MATLLNTTKKLKVPMLRTIKEGSQKDAIFARGLLKTVKKFQKEIKLKMESQRSSEILGPEIDKQS